MSTTTTIARTDERWWVVADDHLFPITTDARTTSELLSDRDAVEAAA